MSGDTALLSIIAERRYPGRGLVLGRDADGVAFGLYWLTGRSPASQLRRIQLGDSSIAVEDLTDGPRDELRHYTAAQRNARTIVLGNGTHVSDVWSDLEAGVQFDEAHRKIAYEPDPPIYTPRITAVADLTADGASRFVTAGAVSDPRWPGITQHRTLHIEAPAAGQGQLVTTYSGDLDNPKPHGNPTAVLVESGWESLVTDVWSALDPGLKIAVSAFPLEGNNFHDGVVKNKNA
ncbi:IMP cyclohydrolase [Paenarthrobacter sp. NPDC057981]|uniref:IMP cyclohydrolase n=1 Tax=Paenarthrobacter sp. NPDC057981 TaxID=3346297 RepID=UPI0036D98617